MGIVQEAPCISSIGRIMLDGVHDIIGQPGVKAISTLITGPISPGFSQANREKTSFGEISTIQNLLEAIYGQQGGWGIAQCAGRASSSMIFRKFGQRMGLNNLDFRLLPTHTRIKVGLEALAATVSDLSCVPFLATEEEEAWIWRVQACPICWQRQSAGPACFFVVGLLQEFVSTLSGGKIHNVVETECLAAGAGSCTFRIDKRGLE